MKEGKTTPLIEDHRLAGAKLAPFGGYLMPIEYKGILSEHRAVRTGMGMFDLSHMGEFSVEGETARRDIDHLMANDISTLDVWQARYTVMCNQAGGIVDDLLVYRYPDHLLLVVNASNILKDFEWISGRVASSTRVRDVSDDVALIAVQGPDASKLVQSLSTCCVAEIGYYHFRDGEVAGIPATISRTGYTGEDGLELYVEAGNAPLIWRALATAGLPQGLQLVGLGARDTLRLEAGLALYGNDIDNLTSPLEAGLGWTVKLDGRSFVGSDALGAQKAAGVRRRLAAFEMVDRAIPRPHYAVLVGNQEIGRVTSGTFSPTFSKGIGLAYLPPDRAKRGTELRIDIRDHPHPAVVVGRPIYRRAS